jgi:plasmid stabilization system protein ParE
MAIMWAVPASRGVERAVRYEERAAIVVETLRENREMTPAETRQRRFSLNFGHFRYATLYRLSTDFRITIAQTLRHLYFIRIVFG